MTCNFFWRFSWFAIWLILLGHSQCTEILSTAASPCPESREPDSRVPCGRNTANHPWSVAMLFESSNDPPRSNADTPSLNAAMQSVPSGGGTSDATTCAACGVELSENSLSLCEDGIETVLLKGTEQPEERESHNTNNLLEFGKAQVHSKLPRHACHFSPNPAPRSVQQDHDHVPSAPNGHDAGVFEVELKKGSKPPGAGTPSPIHNSFPDSVVLNQVDASLKFKGLGLLKEPSGDGHGLELSAKNGHGGGLHQNVLVRHPGRPVAGTPSQAHNSFTDGVASE